MPPAHSHVVCMHSFCWSYWTSSISYCWTCLPFQLRRPAAFPIHSIRGTVLVLYWVCSDGLCASACVCSVFLRGFRALRRTLVLLYRAVRPPRYQGASLLESPSGTCHRKRARALLEHDALMRDGRFSKISSCERHGSTPERGKRPRGALLWPHGHQRALVAIKGRSERLRAELSKEGKHKQVPR